MDHAENLPPFTPLPVDESDCRFTHSFSVEEAGSEEAATFFDKFGFVVFRNVLSGAECEAVRGDMWSLLEEENERFSRRNESTWNAGLAAFGMPKNAKAIFRPPILAVRQHPSAHRCFASAMGTDDIVCSHGRWLLHRKTRDVRTGSGGRTDRPEWRTQRNVHLDANPWEYEDDDSGVHRRLACLRYANTKDFVAENNDVARGMGRCLQGILNLCDNGNSGGDCPGGTLVVPGSRERLADWVRRSLLDEKQRVVGPMQYRVPKNGTLMSRAQLVSMCEGSLLVWDQRLVHVSTPNTSLNNRMAMPIRFFESRVLVSQPERARARACAIARQLREAQFTPSSLGRRVFGLDIVRSCDVFGGLIEQMCFVN